MLMPSLTCVNFKAAINLCKCSPLPPDTYTIECPLGVCTAGSQYLSLGRFFREVHVQQRGVLTLGVISTFMPRLFRSYLALNEG